MTRSTQIFIDNKGELIFAPSWSDSVYYIEGIQTGLKYSSTLYYYLKSK